MDVLSKGDENYLIPSHPIKSKNDIILDNQILNRNFAHVMTDLYDQYFRIPTIELQSSHADLKFKSIEYFYFLIIFIFLTISLKRL